MNSFENTIILLFIVFSFLVSSHRRVLPVKKPSYVKPTSLLESFLNSLEVLVPTYEVYGRFIAGSYTQMRDLEFEDKRPAARYLACLVQHALRTKFEVVLPVVEIMNIRFELENLGVFLPFSHHFKTFQFPPGCSFTRLCFSLPPESQRNYLQWTHDLLFKIDIVLRVHVFDGYIA